MESYCVKKIRNTNIPLTPPPPPPTKRILVKKSIEKINYPFYVKLKII